MALHTTVSPTVTEDPHRPGIPDAAQTLAGYIDLNDIPDWGFLSSFAHPQMFPVTPDWSGPTFDMGEGFIYRYEAGEDWSQRIHEVGSVSSVSLASDSTNYVFYTASNEYEIHDADEPPSDEAALVATLDTASNTVDTTVRGRTPFPLALLESTTEAVASGSLAAVTDPADAIDDSSARLRGELDNLGGAGSVSVYFQHRESGVTAWTQTSKETLTTTADFDATITGLSADTAYEFRSVAVTQGGAVDFGTVRTFTTATAGTTAPTVETDAATSVDADGATLNGDLTSLGSASGGTVFFGYRSLDGSIVGQTPPVSQSSTGTFSAAVSGLPSDTNYEYRAAFDYSEGTVYGSWVGFTTGAGTGLAVTTDSASSVGENSASLNGSLDNLGAAQSAKSYFEYRQSAKSVWLTSPTQTLTTPQNYSQFVDRLQPETQYDFRAVADTQNSGTATGSVVNFTTDAVAEGSLFGWYKLNSGGGTTAVDSAGSNDGTINGATWTTESKTGGQALEFDGGSSWVSLPDYPSQSGYAVTIWVRHESPDDGAGRSALQWRNNGNSAIINADGTGSILMSAYNGSNFDLIADVSISADTWTHLAISWNGSTATGYKNGSQEGTSSTPAVSGPGQNTLGAFDTGSSRLNYWNGELDDARFYDGPLSQSEIQQIYNSTV